jgi:hypothetical protein
MRIKDFWEAHFLTLEFLLAGIFALLIILWSEIIDRGYFLNSILTSRTDLYGTLSTIQGSLLGFSITAVSIIIGYASNPKLEIVKKSKHYPDLWNVFKSAMIILTISTVLSLVGLIFDRENRTFNVLLYLNLFTTILSFFRMGRCIWVLVNIIKIVS